MWIRNFENFTSPDCRDPLGMETGVIQDYQLRASSTYDTEYHVGRGRLKIRRDDEIPAGAGRVTL